MLCTATDPGCHILLPMESLWLGALKVGQLWRDFECERPVVNTFKQALTLKNKNGIFLHMLKKDKDIAALRQQCYNTNNNILQKP